MKTILIVSLHNSNWGAERSTCSVAKYLQSIGYKVIIIIPKEGEIIDLLKNDNLEYQIHYFRGWTNRYGTKYFRAALSTAINTVQALSLYVKLKVQRKEPDIIYSNTLAHGFGILLSVIFRKQHIQHIRENIDSFNMRFNWGYKRTLKFIDQNSTTIVSTCNAIQNRYIEDLNVSKMKVVYNGVPGKPYSQPETSSETFSMVYAGRLYIDKRPIDIMKAINKLYKNGILNINIDIYGDGPMKDEITEYILKNKLDQVVKLKGFENSINFSKYQVGFMPSEFEAFARTTLEYMINGLAVIGTNTGGTKEQIIHEHTGYLYTPGNIDELANCIMRLYEKPEQCIKLGKEGHKRVMELFSQEQYVKKLGKIIVQPLK
jgi:glycosyltransferase involved in cell wall biosynthesis